MTEAPRATEIEAIPTPALVVDLPTVERNVARMAEYVARHGLDLRPHMKTHKSRLIASMQLRAGAVGLSCAKTGEAQVMSQVTQDLLVAYPIVDPVRRERVVQLAKQGSIRVTLDSAESAEQLSRASRVAGSTVGVLVDLDIGYHRTGVQSEERAVALAEQVDRLPNLRLGGLVVYPGHITGPPEQQRAKMEQLEFRLQQLRDAWSQKGWADPVVSSGSSPSALHTHFAPSVTEIRPGTYVYNDLNLVRGGYCRLEDCAARIHATVVSVAVPGQVVLDSGSKTLTSDHCGPAPDSGFGYVVEYPRAKIVRLTEEHGQVDISMCESSPQLGERVTIIPNHICVCVNMQDEFWLLGAEGHPVAHPVDARGLIV